MKKINSFYGIEFTMTRTSSYGRYIIEADYKGRHIKVETTDSEAFDYYNDDSNKEKHSDALRHCYNMIKRAYEDR